MERQNWSRHAGAEFVKVLPEGEIVVRFLDRRRPSSERRVYAQRLAALKTPEALRALVAGFRAEAGEERRVLAGLLGQTGEPIFTESLATLLETGDDAEASVAIRALGAIGGETNIQRLASLMNDDGWPDTLRTEAARELLKTDDESEALVAVRAMAEIGGDGSVATLTEIVHRAGQPESLRLEAALGLGLIGAPRAGEALIAAFGEFSAPEIQVQLLDSLGRFPFPQTEAFWRQFLEAPDTPSELRAAALRDLLGFGRPTPHKRIRTVLFGFVMLCTGSLMAATTLTWTLVITPTGGGTVDWTTSLPPGPGPKTPPPAAKVSARSAASPETGGRAAKLDQVMFSGFSKSSMPRIPSLRAEIERPG